MLDVLIETGRTRVFATAIEWPGWSRSGRDEGAAIEALLEHGSRYKAVVRKRLAVPGDASVVHVAERANGDSSTDFGVPRSPSPDLEPLDAHGLRRIIGILGATWQAFDDAAAAAKGRTLATGPRGGGRTLAKIVAHQREGERAYLAKLGGTASTRASADDVRAAFVDALHARNKGELPDRGPRGGARWTAAEAVRRSAWHALDHAWEIEDRS